MMPELLAHLVGDYCLQNHWMANTKTRSWLAAGVHAFCYTLPFLFLTTNPWTLLIIGATHAVIDHYRLATYWVRFWGVGVEGAVIGAWRRALGWELGEVVDHDQKIAAWTPVGWEAKVYAVASQRRTSLRIDRPPFIAKTPDAPPFLGVWLVIIVDNTLHLAINHFALMVR